MATCSIKLYSTHITPARNALVDDLEVYLGTLVPTYQDLAFQYQKLGLDLEIVVNMPQGTIANQSLGNYCRIAQDNEVWYYFILDSQWKSPSAVSLKLSIDSINTFRNKFTFSPKTTIMRQHGDRFFNRDVGTGNLLRKIDLEPENISAFKLKTIDNKAEEANLNFDWYLMYRTAQTLSPDNLNNPVDCYLFASEPLTITPGSSGTATFTYKDFIDGRYYFFTDLDNPVGAGAVNFPGGAVSNFTLSNGEGRQMVVLHRSGTSLYYALYSAYPPGEHRFIRFAQSQGQYNTYQRYTFPTDPLVESLGTSQSTDPGTFVLINSITINTGVMFRFGNIDYTNIGPYGVREKYPLSVLYISAGSLERKTLSLGGIDRTDSRIVKIIKLPYCPVNVTYSNGVYTFPSEWEYDNGLMKLKDASLSTEFEHEFYSQNIGYILQFSPADTSTTALRRIQAESKLYHSDFYTYKYCYDNFSNEIKWEHFSPEGWAIFGKPSLKFTFKPSNTINSNFDIYCDYAEFVANGQQDYEGHLLIKRNNEETVFSNDYINYIRTGYNYDRKAQQQSTAMNYLGAGLSLVGAIASFAAAGVTGGVSVAAGIALATSSVATLASAASAQATNERNMEAKLAGLRAQATNVAGADDVDLLSYYNGNRMHLIQYNTTTVQRNAIYNLFFYCGYAHNAVEVPNITSRYWFNYIMCKPVFNEESTTLYNAYLDDIKQRFQIGVTVYHHHENQWDWDQQYENWETFLVGAMPQW